MKKYEIFCETFEMPEAKLTDSSSILSFHSNAVDHAPTQLASFSSHDEAKAYLENVQSRASINFFANTGAKYAQITLLYIEENEYDDEDGDWIDGGGWREFSLPAIPAEDADEDV